MAEILPVKPAALFGKGPESREFKQREKILPPKSREIEEEADKKAILVVSFGTSHKTSLELAIGAVEKTIQGAYPDYEIHRAFTSRTIINKLEKRDSLKIDGVAQAMKRLAKEGVRTVICQPTYVMNGMEYEDMIREASDYTGYFKTLRFGKPLLTSTKDFQKVVTIIKQEIPVPEACALVLMGHGTSHFADCTYAALAYHFQDSGADNIFVGAVEGYPGYQDILRHIRAFGTSRIVLAPLMLVAGGHVNKDMAGEGAASWKMRFIREGYAVEPFLKGLGEYRGIQDLYAAHVKSAISGEA